MHRGLSDHSRQTLRKTYPQVPIDERLAAIRDLGRSREPACIPSLVRCLEHQERGVQAAAAESIAELCDLVPPVEVPWLDAAMREVPWIAVKERRLHIFGDPVTRALDHLVTIAPGRNVLMCLASTHRNGFIRQQAVSRLGTSPSGFELGFLLVRLNDWVSEVRSEAARVASKRLTEADASRWVNHLPLLQRLSHWKRTDLTDWITKIDRLLLRPECIPAVVDGTRFGDREVKRHCFRLLLDRSPCDGEILGYALHQKDFVIRDWAVGRAIASLGPVELRAILVALRHDRAAKVRGRAIEALAERFPESNAEWFGDALFDRSAAIRSRAQGWHKSSGAGDPAARYRSAIPCSDARLVGAVMGLGETGAANDALLLIPLLANTRPAVRKAAIGAIGKLDAVTHGERIIDALADWAPGVSREASRVLAAHREALDAARVWDVFSRVSVPHVRQNAILVLASLSRWESIPYILEAQLVDSLTELAGYLLRRWRERMARSFVPPTTAQLERMKEALTKAEGRIPPGTVRELGFILRTESDH